MGFGGLVLSAFALTTLDTATRLCRFFLVELTEKEEGKPAPIVTIVTNPLGGGRHHWHGGCLVGVEWWLVDALATVRFG